MATYYIKNGGNDAASGLSDALAWETITKVNSFADAPGFSPGDIIKFRKGDTWNISDNSPDFSFYPNSGTGAGDVTVTSYTTGSSLKPIIKCSVTTNTGWSNISGNIWQNSNALFVVDVGNILFNGGTSIGVKKQAVGSLTSQGDYWYDFVNNRIRMYSVGSPSIFYSDIECLLNYNLVEITSYKGNTSYITFDGISFQRTAAHAIKGEPTDHITIMNCDFSFIGGADLYGDYTTRFGNAVEFYGSASHNTIIYCTFYEIYDSGITNQDLSSGSPTVTYMSYHHNLFRNMEWPLEYCLTGGSTVHNHIYFEHNTIINAGGQMTHTQRWNGQYSAHIMFWGSDVAVTNGYIRNNIFRQDNGINNAGAWHSIVQYGSTDDGFTIDYNLFDLALVDADIYTGLWPVYVDCKTLANWQGTSGKDAHSIEGDADFTTDYSDLHILTTSDAKYKGVNCGYSVDFDGIALASPPSIGAYEYYLYSPPIYPPVTSPPISGQIRIGAIKILISICTVGIYLRWWFNGWHYFNFQNGYDITQKSESLGTQVSRMFSVISKIERPTRHKIDYAYQITLEGITPGNIGGFTGLLMAERVEQYEGNIWREIDITRGDHLIRDAGENGFILNFEITRKELAVYSTVYQKSSRLYLGDTLCDMDDDEIVPINKQVNDIAEMQDRQSDFTAQFKIRKTRAMRALFELSGEVGASTVFPYENQTCRLIQDNIEVITGGTLILDKVDDQYYYVSILSGNKNFFKTIENLKITDLLLPSTNHTWNVATQAATHIGDPDYVYPLCEPSEDGSISPLTDDGTKVEMYGGWIWPFIKVKAIWDEIFVNAGFICQGDILTNEKFLKLFMPIVNLKIAPIDTSAYLYQGFWQGWTSFLDPINIMYPILPIVGTNYFGWTGIYITPYVATYKFRFTCKTVTSYPSHVYLYSGAAMVIELNINPDFTWPHVWDGEYSAVAGENLTIRTTPFINCIEFVIGVIEITDLKIGYSATITPHLNLPELTQTEFIKIICNMFGLIPDVTPRDRIIRFWNYSELYENIPIARDWSKYLSEREDETEFKYGDYARDNSLRYEDSDDVIKDTGLGIMQIDDETLPAKKDTVELPVSTCDEVKILITNFSVDVSRIGFNKWNDDTGLYDQNDTIDPRIVYINFVKEIASPPYQKEFWLRPTELPLAGLFAPPSLQIITPKKASSLEVSFSNLIYNYASLSRLLTKTNLRRAKFNLPVYEVAGLKHYIPIYLSQYKAYFYVNKINNYVPGQLCTIDLIKL